MARATHRSLIMAFALGWVAVIANPEISGAEGLTRIVTSVDAATTIDSKAISDRDLVTLRLDGAGMQVLPALGAMLPEGIDVDAISLLEDNRVVFSTSVSLKAGGIEADDEDLVLFDRGSLALALDGSAAGLPSAADIDAVHVVSLTPVEIFYSLDAPAEVHGVVFADDDIIRYDGSSHTVVHTGAALLGDQAPRADVDALWYDPSREEYVLSLDVSIAAAKGRTAADAEDLVLWANGSLRMYFDASAAGLSAPGLDLDAVSLEFAFFADDFESNHVVDDHTLRRREPCEASLVSRSSCCCLPVRRLEIRGGSRSAPPTPFPLSSIHPGAMY